MKYENHGELTKVEKLGTKSLENIQESQRLENDSNRT